MIGHEGIATALVRLMRERGAEAARTVERVMGFREGEIRTPAPEDIHPVWIDVVPKGSFPTWMVLAQDTPLRRTGRYSDVTGASDEQEWRYPFQIISHVTGADEYTTALARFRLMLVLRTLLIQTKLLIKTPEEKAVLHLDDMQEIVGGQTQNQQTSKYLMEGRNAFHVNTTEMTPAVQAVWGPVSSIELGGTLL